MNEMSDAAWFVLGFTVACLVLVFVGLAHRRAVRRSGEFRD